MLSENILKRIDAVESVSEFKNLIGSFQLSDADTEIKNAAIRELRVRKHIFDINPLHTPKNVYQDILAGAADISDINS